jgi:four helix bundle protein
MAATASQNAIVSPWATTTNSKSGNSPVRSPTRLRFFCEELPGGRSSAIGDQLARRADSIHQNISGGCGYDTDGQLAKYLRQARDSADEVQDDLETLIRRKLLRPERAHLIADAKLIAKKLSRLIKRGGGDSS